jgi:hypothetical protein
MPQFPFRASGDRIWEASKPLRTNPTAALAGLARLARLSRAGWGSGLIFQGGFWPLRELAGSHDASLDVH